MRLTLTVPFASHCTSSVSLAWCLRSAHSEASCSPYLPLNACKVHTRSIHVVGAAYSVLAHALRLPTLQLHTLHSWCTSKLAPSRSPTDALHPTPRPYSPLHTLQGDCLPSSETTLYGPHMGYHGLSNEGEVY